jgi:hypothetical protein
VSKDGEQLFDERVGARAHKLADDARISTFDRLGEQRGPRVRKLGHLCARGVTARQRPSPAAAGVGSRHDKSWIQVEATVTAF